MDILRLSKSPELDWKRFWESTGDCALLLGARWLCAKLFDVPVPPGLVAGRAFMVE